jgi:hypothetical protein
VLHQRQKFLIASSVALALLAFVAPGARASAISSYDSSITVTSFSGDSHVHLNSFSDPDKLSFHGGDLNKATINGQSFHIESNGINIPVQISKLNLENGLTGLSGKLVIGTWCDPLAVFKLTNLQVTFNNSDKDKDGDTDQSTVVLSGTISVVTNNLSPYVNFGSTGVGTFTDTMNLHGDPGGNGKFQANFPVPEPASLTLWGAVGLVGAWYGRRKLQRRVAI